MLSKKMLDMVSGVLLIYRRLQNLLALSGNSEGWKPMEIENKIENLRTRIEKVMLELPNDVGVMEHKQFLAGYIDCLFDTSQINQEQREILYVEYAL